MEAYAITRRGEPLEKLLMPTPVPTGHEVLIAVTHAGVCHSDLHLKDGEFNLGSRGKHDLASRGLTLPLVPGHEIVGRIVSWGELADQAELVIGSQRLIYPWIGCGICNFCLSDKQNLCSKVCAIGMACDGGYATHLIVPHEKFLLDITGIDPALAATYSCSGLTVYSAIQKLMPVATDTPIIIIGAGGLGLSAIAILRALGHENICVVDMASEKLEIARTQGASSVVMATDTSATTSAIATVCQGARLGILDTVNSSETARIAFDTLTKGGKLVQIGLFGGELVIPLPFMPARALTLQGSYVGGLAELRELIDLAKAGRLRPIPITCMPLDHVNRALEDLQAGQVRGRIVLIPTSA